MALSSKLILASSAISSPCLVTTSGLISTRLQSRSTNSLHSARMNFSAERTLAPVRPSFAAQLADLVGLQAGVGIELLLEDQLRRLGGDLLDVHAAFARGHQHRHRRGAVEDDAQVQLAGDVAACFDEHPADRLALGAGLDRDQLLAEQLRGDVLRFVGDFDELHAALLGVVFDRPLAAAAGVDLGLHDGERAAQLVERRGRFVRRAGDDAAGTATPASRKNSLA